MALYEQTLTRRVRNSMAAIGTKRMRLHLIRT